MPVESQGALGGVLVPDRPATPARPPIIFQPPYPLAWTPELWITTTGAKEERGEGGWGGANVGWSEDQDHYAWGPRVGGPAVAGRLLEPLLCPYVPPIHGAIRHPVDSVLLALDDGGVLTSVAEDGAARLQSLCYVGDGRGLYELVAYTTVRLVGKLEDGGHLYRLSGMVRRGCYGTTIVTHEPGARFALLNGEVARVPLPHRLLAVGARLWIRLVPINGAGDEGGMEDPAAVDPLAFDLEAIGVPR